MTTAIPQSSVMEWVQPAIVRPSPSAQGDGQFQGTFNGRKESPFRYWEQGHFLSKGNRRKMDLGLVSYKLGRSLFPVLQDHRENVDSGASYPRPAARSAGVMSLVAARGRDELSRTTTVPEGPRWSPEPRAHFPLTRLRCHSGVFRTPWKQKAWKQLKTGFPDKIQDPSENLNFRQITNTNVKSFIVYLKFRFDHALCIFIL